MSQVLIGMWWFRQCSRSCHKAGGKKWNSHHENESSWKKLVEGNFSLIFFSLYTEELLKQPKLWNLQHNIFLHLFSSLVLHLWSWAVPWQGPPPPVLKSGQLPGPVSSQRYRAWCKSLTHTHIHTARETHPNTTVGWCCWTDCLKPLKTCWTNDQQTSTQEAL